MSNLLTNLYAYYKLDETSGGATDASVNGRNLGLNGTVTFGAGKINNARLFPGGSGGGGYLGNFGDTVSFQPGANPFFVTGWFKSAVTTYTYDAGMAGKWNAPNASWLLFRTSDGNATHPKAWSFIVAADGNTGIGAYGPQQLDLNWHFVVAGWDGANIKLSVDNATFITTPFAGPVFGNGTGVFGIGDEAAANIWNGLIDEMGIWIGRSLTQAEVSTLYNGGAGLPFSSFNIPAGTTWPSDGSLTGNNQAGGSVQWIHDNLANDGDTITMPSGSFSWAGSLTISKAITLQGNTTVTGCHADGGQNPAILANPVVVDSTVILDNSPNRASPLVSLNGVNKQYRLTGLTFRTGNTAQAKGSNGGIVFSYASTLGRIDHCHIDDLRYDAPLLTHALGGVCDNCLFTIGFNGVSSLCAAAYNGASPSDQFGDIPWSQPSGFGGSNFWFFEDVYFHFGSPIEGQGGLDCWYGGKYVVRYSTLHNMQANSHGTDSSGRWRGVRAVELYNNIYKWDNTAQLWGEFRGGTGVIHDSTYTYAPGGNSGGMSAGNYRAWEIFQLGKSWGDPGRGDSVYDHNDVTDHTGNGLGGGPNGLYASGTTTGPNGSTTLIDANHTWTTNQWIGYTVINVTKGNMGSPIFSNDAHTATYRLVINGFRTGPNCAFDTGDQYEIHHMIDGLDAAGHGQGDLLINNPPIDSVTGTATWPNQAVEPIYGWNNFRNGVYVPISADEATSIPFVLNQVKPGYTPFVYPHPLTSSIVSTGKIISLSGSGLNFGTITIGNTGTGTLSVSNTGDTVLTVSSISYPAGFSGATTGFVVAPSGTTNVTVTFTPLLVQTYSGNITVNSDATSGTNTIAVTGVGVNPVAPVRHKKRARDAYGTGM